MITSAHAIVFAREPDSARDFFRDVLGLPSVDAHDGWLIFKLPPAELAIHPAGEPESPNGSHQLFFMCDDIEATVGELTAKGVEFTSSISRERWGLLTSFKVPGAGEMGLYQPTHPTAFALDG
jgi:catechol 2,3-dioxygenase-like lactoylglutathione lyase family enzyme